MAAYNKFFFLSNITSKMAIRKDKLTIKMKENGFVPKSPRDRFIPKKEEIIVGMEITRVIDVKNFIISFKLLEIIELYVSIVFSKISR